MKITNVKINLIQEGDPLKAFVSITFDESFIVHDLRIIKTNDKTFVAMPSKKLPNGIHKDIVHPLNKETRDEIEQSVLQEYEKIIQD